MEDINHWWIAFTAILPELEATFEGGGSFDIASFMHTHLHNIDTRLMWEFGPAAGGTGHRLVITPETERHLRPLVDEILRRAPSHPGWEFYSHRPAEGFEFAVVKVKQRTGADISLFAVRATRGALNAIDLTWILPEGRAPTAELEQAAFLAT